MWWLTWRQYRLQIIVTVALLLGFGGLLLAHGLATADFRAGFPGCPGGNGPGPAGPGCAGFDDVLRDRYTDMYQMLGWAPVLPVLIGAFWGAPLLAREYERGTHKLTWTQSVSRRRWLAVKLGGLGAVVALCGLALGGMVTAWLSVFDGTPLANEAFSNGGLFVIAGVVPAAWCLFMFAFGAAAGALWRQVLPAMAVTVVAFGLVLYLVMAARPYYAEPERIVLSGSSGHLPTDLIVRDHRWIDPAGRPLPQNGKAPQVSDTCADLVDREAFSPCLYEAGFRQEVRYQPADRYWRFQWTEVGILAALALALGALTVAVTVRRRI